MGSISLRNNALTLLGALQLGGKIRYMTPEESAASRASAGLSIGKNLGMERAMNAYVERVKREMPDMR